MRIDGLFTGQSTNTANIADILARLNLGDMLKAQVLEISTGEVLLKLFDGTVFNAATMSQLDAEPGEFVNFTVKARNGSQLILETVKDNPVQVKSSIPQDVSNFAASIETLPQEKSVEIASQMKMNGMPLEKSAFEDIVKITSQFKDMDIEKSIFLVMNKIEGKFENIENLNRLLDNRFKIGAQLDGLMSALKDIAASAEEGVQPERASEPVFTAQETPVVQEKGDNSDKTSSALSEPAKTDGSGTGFSGKLGQKLLELGLNRLMGEKEIQDIAAGISGLLSKNGRPEVLDDEFIGKLLSQLGKKDPIPVEKRAEKINSIIKEALQSLPKEEAGSRADIAPVIRQDREGRLERVFDKLFVKLNSESLKDEINPKNLYRDIYRSLESVRSVLESTNLPGRDDLLGRVDNLEKSLRFINDINNNSVYLQIPISIRDKKTTGELYILKRDHRRKRIDPGNVTMYVSLDTESLGQVDSLVSIRMKNVSISLKLEKDEIIKLFKDNFKQLYSGLASKGYKLAGIKYSLLDLDANPVNINRVVKRETEGTATSIDYRV